MPADEFEIIAQYFAPLARDEGARGLIDDVALLHADGALVVTTDAVVEGVHFFTDDPIGLVAKKALRVNVSDIAAKGARPIAVTLSLMWPKHRPASEIGDFAHGLGEDLDKYDVSLLGGDTVATSGPLCVSVSAFGAPLGARVPSRADAKPLEDVWVSGAIGDAWLGFEALTGAWTGAPEDLLAYAIDRYRLPQPRTGLSHLIAMHASASMDVSDGLWSDAHKLAAASRLMLTLDAEAAPLSAAALEWRQQAGGDDYGRLFNWGDDYEVLFTAPESARAAIAAGAQDAGVAISRIGRTTAGEGVVILDGGRPLVAEGPRGHTHKFVR